MKAFVAALRRPHGGANLASLIGTITLIGAFMLYPQVFYGFAGYVWRTTMSQIAQIGHPGNAHQLGRLRSQSHSSRVGHTQSSHHRITPVAKPPRVKRAGR